jgi:ABC-type nitrate/sulfonate/bicarbonate transport system substrate-binding protein
MSRLPRLLATGLFLALSALPSAAQNAKLDAALSNSWWGHIPIMLAIDKGYFKEVGMIGM